MQGSFSEEALKLFNSLASYKSSSDFSESYDFTRCIRPDGTGFGTSGKCTPPNKPAPVGKKMNSQADALERKADELMSGGRRNSRAMQEIARRLREKAQKLRQSS